MQELDKILSNLVDNVDGAMAAAVGGMDGLIIDQYPQQGQDLSGMVAEQTNMLSNAQSAYQQQLSDGQLSEIIVTSNNFIGYTKLFNRDLFCFILMNPAGNLGKARLYCEQSAQQIIRLFT